MFPFLESTRLVAPGNTVVAGPAIFGFHAWEHFGRNAVWHPVENWRSKMIRNVIAAAFLSAAIIAPLSTASAQGVVGGVERIARR
jgi:hypothetical protein